MVIYMYRLVWIILDGNLHVYENRILPEQGDCPEPSFYRKSRAGTSSCEPFPALFQTACFPAVYLYTYLFFYRHFFRIFIKINLFIQIQIFL